MVAHDGVLPAWNVVESLSPLLALTIETMYTRQRIQCSRRSCWLAGAGIFGIRLYHLSDFFFSNNFKQIALIQVSRHAV